MSVSYVTYSGKIIIETCCNCGITFGMDKAFQQERLNTGKNFYCPNGHSQHYTDSIAAKLKDAEKKAERAHSNAKYYTELYQGEQRRHGVTERRLSATKGVVTKMKKRATAGVCPCCSRHFEALQRHMASKHPGFGTSVNDEDATT